MRNAWAGDIWWHVGRAAESDERDNPVGLCALATCRTPFLVTDKRQRFCPAEYAYTGKDGRARPGRSRRASLHQARLQRGKSDPG